MGTTQYLVLLSERPEFNAKVRAGFLLGPVAFLQNANENAQGLIGMLGEGLLRIHDEQIGERERARLRTLRCLWLKIKW